MGLVQDMEFTEERKSTFVPLLFFDLQKFCSIIHEVFLENDSAFLWTRKVVKELSQIEEKVEN